MERSAVRILLVEDYAPLRRKICSILQEHLEFQVVAEASEGKEAVLKALELQPDLVLLDISLPGLHGLEVARRIRIGSPKSRILFVTHELTADWVERAFSTGASGYLLKNDAGHQLLIAVRTVLRGEKFLSESLKGPGIP